MCLYLPIFFSLHWLYLLPGLPVTPKSQITPGSCPAKRNVANYTCTNPNHMLLWYQFSWKGFSGYLDEVRVGHCLELGVISSQSWASKHGGWCECFTAMAEQCAPWPQMFTLCMCLGLSFVAHSSLSDMKRRVFFRRIITFRHSLLVIVFLFSGV